LYDWQVELQNDVYRNRQIQNIVAKRGEGGPWILLGTHYDSRIYADMDSNTDNHKMPVPGANDGASGVAVLMELGRVLDPKNEVWLVFFDTEDNGGINGWDWIMGSQAFVENISGIPDSVIIVDMVGDKELDIYIERNSDSNLATQIWSQAASLGHVDKFIPLPKYRMIDDHIPFLQAHIPAVCIIDYDYPVWHTTKDTIDQISPESLQIVGDVLLAWLHSLK